jgi:hypothetical protein
VSFGVAVVTVTTFVGSQAAITAVWSYISDGPKNQTTNLSCDSASGFLHIQSRMA